MPMYSLQMCEGPAAQCHNRLTMAGNAVVPMQAFLAARLLAHWHNSAVPVGAPDTGS